MLSPEQIKQREGKLTASRVAVLMNGDAEGIMRLYREMIGEEQPEDLSKVWPVRLGETTEQLQCDWFEEQNGELVTRRGEVVVHPTIPWAACTLDGWIETMAHSLECKHVGGREPLEVVIERYQPQFQWTMLVTQTIQIAVSIIMGANAPIIEYIEADPEYQAEMVRRGRQFMACVMQRREPVALAPVPPPVEATRLYDMSDNPTWKRNAEQWLQCYGAAQTAKDCEKVLKSLVPEDAKKCVGYDVQITRDRAGRLSLRVCAE